MFRSSEGSISEARKVLHRLRIAELLLPADPGGLRLLAALRATLAGVLTFFLVVLLGTVAPLPVTDRILGFGIALFVAANVCDPTPRRRLITIALALPFACLATGLAAVLSDQPLIAATLLPLIMFAVAYGATCGPRWASLGNLTIAESSPHNWDGRLPRSMSTTTSLRIPPNAGPATNACSPTSPKVPATR